MNAHTYNPSGLCFRCGHWKDDPVVECPLTDEEYQFAVNRHPAMLHQMRGYNRSYWTALRYLRSEYANRFGGQDE